MPPAAVMADLWKLGHHNPDQVVSAYCVHRAPRPHSNCLLQSSKSCLTYQQIHGSLLFFSGDLGLASELSERACSECGGNSVFDLWFRVHFIGISLAILKTHYMQNQAVQCWEQNQNNSDQEGHFRWRDVTSEPVKLLDWEMNRMRGRGCPQKQTNYPKTLIVLKSSISWRLCIMVY